MRSFKLEQTSVYNKVIRYNLLAGVAQDVYSKNYSTVKSPYGLDSLTDGTFTGDSVVSTDGSPATTIYTDTGEVLVSQSRYRDVSASVVLTSIDTYGATISNAPISTSPEWITVEAGDYLSRFIKSDIDATITLTVGPTLVSSDTDETPILADIFPEWMDIRTETTSHGYRLLKVLSEDIEDIKFQAINYPQRAFINMISTDIKAFAYLSELPNYDRPIDVYGIYDESPYDLYVLSPAESLREFIEAEETKHLYYIDGKYIFTCGEYDTLSIDSVTYPQEQVHIVNMFDNIGAYLSLPRLPGESNAGYKVRILNVYENPPGASWSRLPKAIERDSGVPIKTIYELYNSDVPWVAENDPAVSGVFYAEPTDEQTELARWCREHGAIGWDYFVWGKTLFDLYPHPWDLAEVPYLLDHTLSEESPAIIREPGIGYDDDLEPKKYEFDGSFPYSITVSANGFVSSSETIYPPVTVTGKVIPSATKSIYANSFTGYSCLEVTYDGSIYCLNIPVYIPEDSLVAVNTNTFLYELCALSTSQKIECALKTDTAETYIDIAFSDITKYELKDGYWDFANQTLDANTPASELTLGFDDALSINPWVVASQSDAHPTYIYVEHQTSYSTTDTAWTGDGTPFTITCNTNNSELPASISVPTNLESEVGLGTITYTLDIDSFSPSGAGIEDTPIDTIIEFSTGGDTIVGWPGAATITLESTYQMDVTKYTPYVHTSTVILSGTLTTESPIAIEVIDPSDFSLPANFVGGKYVLSITGEVYARTDYSITDDPVNLIVELNPVYMFEWPPLVKPGTLYLDGTEYYLHYDSETESITGTTYTLLKPVAPGSLLSFSENLVETHFVDATGVPTLTITQNVYGNGSHYLPIWYENAVNITVDDVSKSLLTSNIVDYGSDTDEDTVYEISYQVTDSYCVDYANYYNGEYLPKITLQAAHAGLTVTYTPYNDNGYWVNTDVPTNPLFTLNNRDFLYIDTTAPIVDQVVMLGSQINLYEDISNVVWCRAVDSDYNGVSGVTISFVSDNGETMANCVTDDSGYAYSKIVIDESSPAPTTITITATDDSSPANTDSFTYNVIYDGDVINNKMCLVSQAYQVAIASQSVTQTIKLLLLNSDGTPRLNETGSYTITCSNSSGSVTATPITSNSATGIITLSLVPAYVGRYVASFTFGDDVKEIGWSLVERT